MRRTAPCVGAALLILTGFAAAVAEEAKEGKEGIKWAKDVAAAWQKSQDEQRPMMIFVTADNCKFCRMMENDSFQNATVIEQINSRFVPVVLDATEENSWVKSLKVTSFPTTIVISPQRKLLDSFRGYLPPDKLNTRLADAAAGRTADARNK